jgi:flagellar protein FliJ
MTRPYRFQLETLRRLRAEHRDAQRQRLGEAMEAARLLEERRLDMLRELDDLRGARRAAVGVTTPDVNRLLDFQRYELLVQAQLEILETQQLAIEAEVDRRRAVLAEAEKQVRVLDKLDTRRQREHRAQELRSEELVLNEIATQSYLRNSGQAEV